MIKERLKQLLSKALALKYITLCVMPTIIFMVTDKLPVEVWGLLVLAAVGVRAVEKIGLAIANVKGGK